MTHHTRVAGRAGVHSGEGVDGGCHQTLAVQDKAGGGGGGSEDLEVTYLTLLTMLHKHSHHVTVCWGVPLQGAVPC